MSHFGFFDNKEKMKCIPFYAVIELTYRCNFNCVHCYRVSEKRPELTYEEICRLFDELAECGCLVIGFSGGEVFLREDLLTLAYIARKKNFALSIFTNGSMITDKNASELEALKLLKLHISLYGASSNTYYKVTRNDRAYDQVMRSLELLKERQIRTIFGAQILTHNYLELGQMAEIAKSVTKGKFPFRYNARTFPAHDCNEEPLKHSLSKIELGKVMREDPSHFIVRHESIRNLRGMPCGIGISTVGIGPYGDVYPCTNFRLSLGNIRHQSFRDIWFKTPELLYLRERLPRDFASCQDCSLQLYCSRCPALSFLKHRTNGSSYCTEVCRDAIMRKEAFSLNSDVKKGGQNETHAVFSKTTG